MERVVSGDGSIDNNGIKLIRNTVHAFSSISRGKVPFYPIITVSINLISSSGWRINIKKIPRLFKDIEQIEKFNSLEKKKS